MVRHNFHEARTLHLRWDESRKGFEFRLMYGNRYLTPQLWLTPFDWYKLLDSRGRVVLLGNWLKVWRKGNSFCVAPQQIFRYNHHTGLPQEWPSQYFPDIYNLAMQERGDKPEKGWEKVYEREMEKERENWSS